jgi:hypothetical protein
MAVIRNHRRRNIPKTNRSLVLAGYCFLTLRGSEADSGALNNPKSLR